MPAHEALLLVVQPSRSTRLRHALAASHLRNRWTAATAAVLAAARSAQCIYAPALPGGMNSNTSDNAPLIHKHEPYMSIEWEALELVQSCCPTAACAREIMTQALEDPQQPGIHSS